MYTQSSMRLQGSCLAMRSGSHPHRVYTKEGKCPVWALTWARMGDVLPGPQKPEAVRNNEMLNIWKWVYCKWVSKNLQCTLNSDFAIFDNFEHLEKRYSFDLLRPRERDEDHGAGLPFSFAPSLMQIR
jgi:hypothetical protein